MKARNAMNDEIEDVNEERTRARKPYEKPRVMRFPLRPEEAVLGFCKTTAGSGPSGGGCLSVTICHTQGS
jgi:hypothetical protein